MSALKPIPRHKAMIIFSTFVVVSAVAMIIISLTRVKCNPNLDASKREGVNTCIMNKCNNEYKKVLSAKKSIAKALSESNGDAHSDKVRQAYDAGCPAFHKLDVCGCKSCQPCNSNATSRARCTLVMDATSKGYCNDDHLNEYDLDTIKKETNV